jgi:hypothetical protein
MATDQVVDAKDILHALSELRRLGAQRVIQDLEKQEPDLVEYLLEEVTAIHHELMKLGDKPKRTRLLSQRVEATTFVLVTAMRKAWLRLWTEQAAGSRLGQLDDALALPEDAGSEDSPESRDESGEQHGA